jgi:hypothetical protein
MMLLGAMHFIQFELVQKCLRRRLEKALFIGKSIPVAGQVDAEYILFVKDNIPFLIRFHPAVRVSFGIVLDRSVGGSAVLGQQLHHQGRGENGQEDLISESRLRRLLYTHC